MFEIQMLHRTMNPIRVVIRSTSDNYYMCPAHTGGSWRINFFRVNSILPICNI